MVLDVVDELINRAILLQGMNIAMTRA